MVDNIAGGRLWTTLAAGYVKSEFSMFGKSLDDRARLMDEGLEVIVRALSGERFEWRGREIFVRPLPPSGTSQILVGGGVKAAARRAIRNGVGLWTAQSGIDPKAAELIAYYKEECARLDMAPGPIGSVPPVIWVARDIEAEWERIGRYVLHLVESYASWASDVGTTSSPFYGMDTVDKIRAAGFISVLTPEQAVELGQTSPVTLTPLVSGVDPKIGWEMLELFAAEVVPNLPKG